MNLNEVRRCHYLRPNHRSTRPRRWLVLDTETRPSPSESTPGREVHRFRLAVLHLCRWDGGSLTTLRRTHATTLEDVWAAIRASLSDREPLWICAHNLPFDWSIIHGWTMTAQCGWEEDWSCWRDPPSCAYYRTPLGNVRITDTLNYVRAPLAQLGAGLGLPKLAMPRWDAPDTDWLSYCERDVEITREVMGSILRWHQLGDLGTWRPTLAGIGWNAYRHRWMYHPILVHGHADVLRLERDAYRGGRSHAWYVGRWDGAVYHVDVRSAYPSAMGYTGMPSRLICREVMPSLDSVRDRLRTCCAIARVVLRAEAHDYPVSLDGVKTYARGQLHTVLATPELVRALATGEVQSVGHVAWYRRDDLFSRFVSWCYSQRQHNEAAGRTVEAELCRRLPCALYGRFGARCVELVDEPDTDSPVRDGPWARIDTEDRSITHYVAADCVARRIARDTLTDDACPAIAAHITSAQRVRMDELRALAGQGGVLLQYVDSLLLTRAGWERLDSHRNLWGDDLGQLRLCGHYNGVTIHSSGHWVADSVRHCPGIPPKALLTDGDEYEWLQFERGAGMLRRGPDGSVIVSRIRRRAPVVPVVGTRGSDGWVTPLEVSEE